MSKNLLPTIELMAWPEETMEELKIRVQVYRQRVDAAVGHLKKMKDALMDAKTKLALAEEKRRRQ